MGCSEFLWVLLPCVQLSWHLKVTIIRHLNVTIIRVDADASTVHARNCLGTVRVMLLCQAFRTEELSVWPVKAW